MTEDRDLDRPICVQCWHPFTPATGNQKYCSVDCRETNRKRNQWRTALTEKDQTK